MTHEEWTLARVIGFPIGEAPEGVRKQLVGVAFSGRFIGVVAGRGIISGERTQPRDTFAVPYGIAIQTLEATGRASAAHFFHAIMQEQNIDPVMDLFFGTDEVEVVDGENDKEAKWKI